MSTLPLNSQEILACVGFLNLEKKQNKDIWDIIYNFRGRIVNKNCGNKQEIIIYSRDSNILAKYCNKTKGICDSENNIIGFINEMDSGRFIFEILDSNKKILGKILFNGELYDKNEQKVGIHARDGYICSKKNDNYVIVSKIVENIR